MDANRNNLDFADSPYLRQHKDNPVWWQQWSLDAVEQALITKRPLFVSVGYSTCHWCHVMAVEAFSDPQVADYLNKHFISIKVDREQRPDIDHYLMDFLTHQTGAGGWPLNAFLTPTLAPIYALTYAPAVSRGQSPGFLDIARQIAAFYDTHGDTLPPFKPTQEIPPVTVESDLIQSLLEWYDAASGGFGAAPKFPPHSTLLFLLYTLCVEDRTDVRTMCRTTLDAMRRGGLTDHLQGGVFRYCVDQTWTIPHFEKMLYDQAMMLWTYSLAYRVMDEPSCKKMAENVLRCLNECFRQDDLFITALDADTDHKEGGTYLWTFDELKTSLNDDEFAQLSDIYAIKQHGNFDGTIHLIRKTDDPADDIEARLLAIRRKRPQPTADTKILSGLNALTAAAMIQAARWLDNPAIATQAAQTIRRLLNLFWDGQMLSHSFSNGRLQRQDFLFDAAATLLAITMLYEDDPSVKDQMDSIAAYVASFCHGQIWIESKSDDFLPVPASWFDHPIPSSGALAEMAQTRYRLATGTQTAPAPYRRPYQADFYNINAMMQNGLFHIQTRTEPANWSRLSPNTIQLRGTPQADCYRGVCRKIE